MNIEELKKVQSMTLDEINQIIEEAKGLRNQIQNFMFDISYQLCNANKDKLDIIVDKLLNAKNSFTEKSLHYRMIGLERSYIAKDNNESIKIINACGELILIASQCNEASSNFCKTNLFFYCKVK